MRKILALSSSTAGSSPGPRRQERLRGRPATHRGLDPVLGPTAVADPVR
jgi:hypothetical protein